MAGFSPTSDILPEEADHEYCYDLCCASADTLRGVRTELKSTVLETPLLRPTCGVPTGCCSELDGGMHTDNFITCQFDSIF